MTRRRFNSWCPPTRWPSSSCGARRTWLDGRGGTTPSARSWRRPMTTYKRFSVLFMRAKDLAAEIEDGIRREAVVVHRRTGEAVYAYEVDGFGNAFHMDDANVPSLLSLPYLGFVPVNDTTYQSTRRIVLSAATNPFYFQGAAGQGVGSPHTGPGKIWPMSVIMQALTSQDDDEIRACLSVLRSTTASRWFMHESFDKDDATAFTRPWFSWANSLFGQLIFHLAESRPHLLLRPRAPPEAVV
ncbi:unnamed protein product [Prorocentrum cordatum]|uniref:Metal-independent alpha-mannosidase n=1 Tax=Prorocentrum cordatum TaxID=2364126 RepID=A0ABN9PJK9_9DINO|nr:unnamed protein product [Polarella glacialis]